MGLPGDVEAGEAAVAEATRRAEAVARPWRPSYPAAVDCLLADFQLLTAHLQHPRSHWPRIRHKSDRPHLW